MAARMDIFRDSVKSVLDGWTVLQLAVQHGFGGVHSTAKAQWMVEAVYQWFQDNAGIEPTELEDFLAVLLNNEFDTLADDGSLPQVAEQICGYYRLCQQGRQQEVLSRIQQLPMAQLAQCVAAAGPEQEEEDEEDEDEKEEGSKDEDMEVTQSGSMENGPQSHIAQHQHTDTTSNTSAQDMESQSQEDVDDGWTVVSRKKKH